MRKGQKRGNTLVWTIAIIAGIGLIALIVWGVKSRMNPSPDSGGIESISENDWTAGSNTSGVVLIEYSDFQCPACRAYYPILKQLKSELGDQFFFAYRHFPLPQHTNAPIAAVAAEVAGTLGKFWEMHDQIFEHQPDWSEVSDPQEKFAEYAAAIGLDRDQFLKEFTVAEHMTNINSDYASGRKAGVNSTPTFFLNGRKISNPRSLEEFKNVIQRASSPNTQ